MSTDYSWVEEIGYPTDFDSNACVIVLGKPDSDDDVSVACHAHVVVGRDEHRWFLGYAYSGRDKPINEQVEQMVASHQRFVREHPEKYEAVTPW
jgi:hypothetical protein